MERTSLLNKTLASFALYVLFLSLVLPLMAPGATCDTSRIGKPDFGFYVTASDPGVDTPENYEYGSIQITVSEEEPVAVIVLPGSHGECTLTIYDFAGRVVQTWESIPADEASRRWDISQDADVSAGIYRLVLEDGEKIVLSKITVVR